MFISTNARYFEVHQKISPKDSEKADFEIRESNSKTLYPVEVSSDMSIKASQAVEPHHSGRIPRATER